MSFDSFISSFEGLSRATVQGVGIQAKKSEFEQEVARYPGLRDKVESVWGQFAALPEQSRIERVCLLEQMAGQMPLSQEERARALSLRSWSYLSDGDKIRAMVEICRARVLPASTREILERVYTGEVRNRVNLKTYVQRAIENGNGDLFELFSPRMTEAEKRGVALGIRDAFLASPRNKGLAQALQKFDAMFPEMELFRSVWEKADLEASIALLDAVPERLLGPVWIDCVIRSRYLPDGAVFQALQARGKESEAIQKYVAGLSRSELPLATKGHMPPEEEKSLEINLEFED